jgi:hypothetical protein
MSNTINKIVDRARMKDGDKKEKEKDYAIR